MTKANGSAVVDVMQTTVVETWRAWRAHVTAGTASSPEGLAALDAAQLAVKTLAGERADRLAAGMRIAAPQGWDKHGCCLHCGLPEVEHRDCDFTPAGDCTRTSKTPLPNAVRRAAALTAARRAGEVAA